MNSREGHLSLIYNNNPTVTPFHTHHDQMPQPHCAEEQICTLHTKTVGDLYDMTQCQRLITGWLAVEVNNWK